MVPRNVLSFFLVIGFSYSLKDVILFSGSHILPPPILCPRNLSLALPKSHFFTWQVSAAASSCSNTLLRCKRCSSHVDDQTRMSSMYTLYSPGTLPRPGPLTSVRLQGHFATRMASWCTHTCLAQGANEGCLGPVSWVHPNLVKPLHQI